MEAIVKEIDINADGKIELSGLPFSKNDHVEVILIKKSGTKSTKNRPSPEISGTKITGDIMKSVISEEEWEALK